MLFIDCLIKLAFCAFLSLFLITKSNASPVELNKSHRGFPLAQRSPSRPVFQGAALAAAVASTLGQSNVLN
ncbi:hypothetical protein OnM2_000031 [Erysiphe neolycopersici]|uniref:Secreted protein n=1 Tax=Erysiphe neolycopersici TaxID=212602 RepID=A0A420I8L4_9PEZI|nr:hypothetical protein OnM2_000031 [Erysiphe neolycopersici]